MDKDVLEIVLKKNWKDASLEKVLSVESTPAVGKNLNFLSNVTRLNLKVVLGNGRVAKKSLVMKASYNSDEDKLSFDMTNSFNKKYETFRIETMMYNTLTEIEYLMEEFEDTEDVLWCKMVHHIPYKCIVMEDLKTVGFRLIDRVKFYDLDHALLSVHSLGRYHGMCKTLETRGLCPQGLKPYYLFDNVEMQNLFYWDTMALVEGVGRLWNPSWKPIIEKIKITKDEVLERLKKFSELDEAKFNVLNHGDCHKNNILIKYNWDNRPIAMRFLDFQVVHYGSPCIDLTYMLYTAVAPCVRRDNFDLILRTYHDALLKTLDKYHFEGNKPGIEEIREGMEKYCFMGLLLVLSWYPSLLKSENMFELRDFKKIISTQGKEGYVDECFNPDDFEKELGPDIKAFVDRFCSDSY